MLVGKPSRVSVLVEYAVRYAGWPFVFLLCFDAAVASTYVYFNYQDIALPHVPLPLFGSAIGVLIGFRNTGAYARWWEARQLLGSIVNDSRTLARQVIGFFGSAKDRRAQRTVSLQIAYVQALRLQLRRQDVLKGLEPYLDSQDLGRLSGEKNVALAIQNIMGQELVQECKELKLSDLAWKNIDETLTRLMGAQGGLERIRNTPMPRQYDYFLRFFVGVYCLLLPFGMVDKLGLFTPFGSSILGLIFLMLDKIGREIESPFENKKTDLPLTSITTTIEINLRQMLGQERLPPSEEVRDGVLW